MRTYPCTSSVGSSLRRRALPLELPRWIALPVVVAFGLLAGDVSGAELLYQEDFNTDGEKAQPPRYTSVGREVYEKERQVSELSLTDQSGPVFWGHNFEVSYVGVPAPTPARRAALAWDGVIAAEEVSADFWTLFDATMDWLLQGKRNAKVVFSPNGSTATALVDHLTAAGHTVADDDETASEASLGADLVIKLTGGNPSRFSIATVPLLCFSALDHDDQLLSSIGSVVTFEAGPMKIVTPGHPAAGGLTGTKPFVTGTHGWNLLGDTLPGGAIQVASFLQQVPPTAANLADVDAMVAGTKPSVKATELATDLDYSDSSSGNWFSDHPIPGGATGVFGLVATGKLAVSAPGKYSFALGMDDGARLRIDVDKNGLSAADNVITDDVAGAHRVLYADVTFASAGTYDFEATMFNSGGGGDLELSVSTQADGGDTSALDSGTWELLGQTSGNVALEGSISASSYVPSGDVEELERPLLVLLNGPTDNPPGAVFGGGPFNGFEGAGFFGMAGGNKWPLPDGRADRNLTLRSVNVAGKSNVKLTVALAASFLDFETSDYLDIIAHPGGAAPEVTLARYSAPDANTKYLADITHGNSPKLGLTFQDVTYDIPAGATDLVIEFRAISTWWNEILAFDNVRLTAGAADTPIRVISFAKTNQELTVNWEGGDGPFQVQTQTAMGGTWTTVGTTSARTFNVPMTEAAGFVRIVDP